MKTQYVADDGAIFDTERDCYEYEKEMYQNARLMLGSIPHYCVSSDDVFPNGDYASGELFLKIENEQHADLFVNWAATFDFCFDVAIEFMKSEEYEDMRLSLYEALDHWVHDNEMKIREIMEMHSHGKEH